MTEIQVTKDPTVLAAEIRFFQQQAQVVVLSYAIEIGRRLTEAKSVLKHGQWGEWLKNEVAFSQSTANNFMRIFERYGDEQVSLFGDAKSQTLGNLPYTKALRLLAVPEDEAEEFMEEHDVSEMSTRELEQAIRERDAAKKALEEEKSYSGNLMDEADKFRKEAETAQAELKTAEAEASAAREKANQLQKELEELQNRPVEVAVQAPTEEMMEEIRVAEQQKFQQEREALEKKVADAEAKAKKQADKVKDLKDAAEKAKEAARTEIQKEIESAQKAREVAEAEKKTAETRAAELEKKLKMADSSTATFQVYFQGVQEDCNRMLGIIKKSDKEQAEKLKKAMKALIDSVGMQLE